MPKSAVTDWDISPSLNTDIDGINIDEECPASGINNAIRAIMAQIATFIGGGVAAIIDIFTGTADNKIITPKGAADSAKWVTLADGATITVDGNAGFNFKVTLGGNRTLAFTNMKEGQIFNIMFTQDATGGRTITWDASQVWNNGDDGILSTAAGAKDLFSGIVLTASPLSIISTIPLRGLAA